MNRTSSKHKYSIRAKLTLIIVSISMITLLLAASLFTLTQLREQEYILGENLTAVAKITGGNVQAALAFEDVNDATKILSDLENDPRITAAGIYNKNNRLFASYSRLQNTPSVFELPEQDGYFFEARQLHLLHTIYLEGENEFIGKVYIQASLDLLYEQLMRNLSITGIIVLLSLFLSIILAARLQKLISIPILKLSDATDKVKNEKDFSVRVKRDDFLEIEHLCDGFNNMLEHIQNNEQELLESHNLLEQRVTERTEELEIANIELKKSKEEAESANKAKSQFLASMSHELRTPLNAIIGFTELILGKPGLDHIFENYINIINQSGDHLLALINDILDMAKIEAGKLEIETSNIDLFYLLESTVAMLDVRAQKKDINLLVEYDSDLPQYINIDDLKLRQILINLIGNAIKFTEKGEIRLNVSYQADKENKTTGKLYISISDTGSGMKPEEMDDLFSPFTQTESGRKQHGTGLGLNLSKSYIELMGGVITVDSTFGEGTCFNFYLKTSIVQYLKTGIQVREKVNFSLPEESGKILIVEDIEHNRKLLTKLINKTGHKIKIATNGLEAVESFSMWNPDVILMDIKMPVMNGIEALEKIRQLPEGSNVKIIALTASGLNNNLQNLTKYRFDELIYKPYREREIYSVLKRHIDIKFTYEPRESIEHIEKITDKTLSNDDLTRAFSKESLNALQQAAVEGNIYELYKLIDSIDSQYAETTEELRKLIDEFQFDVIISMFTPYSKSINQ